MKTKPCKKILKEGQYLAEVEVQVIETEEGWSPCLSLDDAYKLDDVRESLRRGDLRRASEFANVYTLNSIVILANVAVSKDGDS